MQKCFLSSVLAWWLCTVLLQGSIFSNHTALQSLTAKPSFAATVPVLEVE